MCFAYMMTSILMERAWVFQKTQELMILMQQSPYPEELKHLVLSMLEWDFVHRPNIEQVWQVLEKIQG